MIKRRLQLMMAFFAAVLAALSVRIGFLQLYDDEPLSVMAEGQYLTELTEMEQRGEIFDRNGKAMTGGKTYAYYYIGEDLCKKDSDQSDSYHRSDLLRRLGCRQVREFADGYCIWKGEYSRRNQIRIEEEYGAMTVQKKERYADDQPAVHLLGYTARTGEGGKEEGQCGLEKMYDLRLCQGAEKRYVSRDAAGNILRGNGVLSHSQIDRPFLLTVDLNLQRQAELLLSKNDRPGAAVVSDAKTGEILASASYPVYNPNSVGDHLTSEKNELIDRVSAAAYPPGSVFKLIVAAAALEAGIAEEDSLFECKGSIEAGGITVGCSTGGEKGHGRITLRQALTDSCNCAFIQLGIKVGGQKIIEMAEAMGMGCDVCPQLSENTGHLPESAEECGIANLSIGQGTILATPLQVTSMMNCIASGGIRFPLKILMPDTQNDLIKYDVCPEILMDEDKRGQTGNSISKNNMSQNSGGFENRDDASYRVLSEKTADTLLSMMRETTETGTAKKISEFTEELPGGKTGSAQSVMSGQTVVHGWFSGCFPKENPQYVITVFMENGGGAAACLPVAGGLVRYLSEEMNEG